MNLLAVTEALGMLCFAGYREVIAEVSLRHENQLLTFLPNMFSSIWKSRCNKVRYHFFVSHKKCGMLV